MAWCCNGSVRSSPFSHLLLCENLLWVKEELLKSIQQWQVQVLVSMLLAEACAHTGRLVVAHNLYAHFLLHDNNEPEALFDWTELGPSSYCKPQRSPAKAFQHSAT
eukprot:1611928-Amphidinium_carterae.2